MDVGYEDVVDPLRAAYDSRAGWRDGLVKQPWKLAERTAFLGRLREEGCGRLLEVGAATRADSGLLKENGVDLIAGGLPPAWLPCCRTKGIEAPARSCPQVGFPPEAFHAP